MSTRQNDLAIIRRMKASGITEVQPLRLLDKTTGIELIIGDIVHDFRNEPHILVDARPPHKPSSEGFVTLRSMDEKAFTHEYYAWVIDAEWVC